MIVPKFPATGQLTALVVDDDDSIRESLLAYLEEFGFKNILAAKDGAAALRILATSAPDVLLLDLMMPVTDGFEVLKAIRTGKTAGRPGRVIVLSAHSDREMATRVIQLGADGYIGKPFTDADLMAALGLSDRGPLSN